MSVHRLQGKAEKQAGIYYEFDPSEKPLGIGGMGKVYRGRCVDERGGYTREVAIKFLYSDLPLTAIERSKREAEIRIKHKNLVEMLGFIDVEDAKPNALGEVGHHYHVVSELLDGVMLDDLMKGITANAEGRAIPLAVQLYHDYQNDRTRFAVQIIRGVLSGLQALHDEGYIHRDIDPTNIMITSTGYVKLIDFGIAKKINTLNTLDKALTISGVFLGKPEYAAPELILGDLMSQDFSTDTYAVGILLYQCYFGHIPFEGDRAEIMRRQCHEKLPIPSSGIGGDLKRIIRRATEKDRQKRFRSAAEFRVAIDKLTVGPRSAPIKWGRVAITTGALAVVAGLAFLLTHLPEPELKQEMDLDVKQEPELEPIVHEDEQSYSQLLARSYDGDAEASYLLYQAFFQPEEDVLPTDEVNTLRQEIIKEEPHVFDATAECNVHALRYLQKAVESSPENYKYLYELGENYFGGASRASGLERDVDKAKMCYQTAAQLAEKQHDEVYITKIQERLDRLNR